MRLVSLLQQQTEALTQDRGVEGLSASSSGEDKNGPRLGIVFRSPGQYLLKYIMYQALCQQIPRWIHP